ncbi:unnamed protein product [Closterium sp. NIES-53]
MHDKNNRILGAGQLTASQVDLRIDEREFCRSLGVALGVELEEEGLEVRPLVWPCLVVQRGVEVALGVASSNSRAARRSSRCNSFVSGRSAGGTRVGGASPQESLLPHQLRAWANRWDGPGGGAGGADSGSAVPTGTRGSGSVTTQPQQSALCHLLSLSPGATEFSVVDTTPPLLFPPTNLSQPQLLLGYPVPTPAPHTCFHTCLRSLCCLSLCSTCARHSPYGTSSFLCSTACCPAVSSSVFSSSRS